MAIEQTIEKNLRFLTLEVIKQVERAQRVLDAPSLPARRQVSARDDYIDHLRSVIENKIFEFLGRHGDLDKAETDQLRSVGLVATNLERIADHCVNVMGQLEHFDDPRFFHRYAYAPFFETIIGALRRVLPAVHDRDTAAAIEVCRAEARLDDLYRQKFERILAEMALGRAVPELVTSLFIFHYLERMGDCLKNVGEAIIFAKMGERLKYHQYQAVRDAMHRLATEGDDAANLDFEGIWGTRSGCRVGKIHDPDDEEGPTPGVIYKEGDRDKIRREKESIERWERILPGLPPRVVEYQENDRDAALLIEYLEGRTFQELLLSGESQRLARAQSLLESTLTTIWSQTAKPTPVQPRFLEQLSARLEDVVRVHPFLREPDRQIGVLRIPELPQLLAQSRALDDELQCPFSVFGHGDFNIDNIIFDLAGQRVHFIDLYRSRDMDYVHMVTVFMVSIFRLPVFDTELREVMNEAVFRCYRFARQFATQQQDRGFAARMALGLVRSFATSTRFESERVFARDMLRRAVYLLEKLSAHRPLPWDTFHFPEDVLNY